MSETVIVCSPRCLMMELYLISFERIRKAVNSLSRWTNQRVGLHASPKSRKPNISKCCCIYRVRICLSIGVETARGRGTGVKSSVSSKSLLGTKFSNGIRSSSFRLIIVSPRIGEWVIGIINCSTAEMLYGTSVRIPSEFFENVDFTVELQMLIQEIRNKIRSLRS